MTLAEMAQQKRQSDKKSKAWVLKESTRLSDDVMPMGSPTQRQMLKFWKLYRPKMWMQLNRLVIAKELAHVLDEKYQEAIDKNLAAGMYVTDAREEAEKDWLLLEPEESELQEG